MLPKPLIIDCDPGVDDAIALLLALASPEVHVLGITTVAGNLPLEMTQSNARRICELANRVFIPVHAGCPRPLLRPLITAEAIHGDTGLGGVFLPEPQMPIQPQHAVEYLIDTIRASSQPVTLATLGPLTNLAIALIKAPHIAQNIQEVVMMGGAISQGNVTPSAEFNIYVDPHAAQVVFTSGLPLTLFSLDVTHQVLTTPDRLEAIRAIATPVGQAAATMLGQYGMEESLQKGLPGGPLHDPCVIAYLIRPYLFSLQSLFVEVETTSALTMGRTVVDLWNDSRRAPNITVARTADAGGIYELLTERLALL